MSKAAQKREKQEWAIEKPTLDNVRKLRGTDFIDPGDGAYKETINNARKKLEVPMEAAMPCKMGTRKRITEPQQTAASRIMESNRKTKVACIVEAHESTRKRVESTLPRSHEDHIAQKGLNSESRNNLVHKYVPMLHVMKTSDAKAAADKEWQKLEKLQVWQVDTVKSKKK